MKPAPPPLPRASRPGLLALRVVLVRLRLLAVPAVAFAIVLSWPMLRNYWDKLTRPGGNLADSGAVSVDTEYFCPMCPGVVSDWPAKCPVCNMALVRRRRGEAVPLPDGVVARMQLSPYRIQLAGIQTSAVGYRPLVQEVTVTGFVDVDPRRLTAVSAPLAGEVRSLPAGSVGMVVKKGDALAALHVAETADAVKERLKTSPDGDMVVSPAGNGCDVLLRASAAGHVAAVNVRRGEAVQAGALLYELADLSSVVVDADLSEKDLPLVTEGQPVEALSDAFPGHAPFRGKVGVILAQRSGGGRSLRVRLEIDNPERELRPGLLVTAPIRTPVQRTEPFRSMPTSPSPLKTDDLREVWVCPQHPDQVQEQPGRCPLDQRELEPRLLAMNQRLGWWCPTHPQVTAERAGAQCPECNGMRLVPRIITYNPPGEVLAVPESAVVDTGTRRVVYVERMPGMFEGVEVVLGRRCGDDYPVIRGLEAGQRVATAGGVLIDAEAKLNPSLAASYFGANRSSAPAPERSPSPSPSPPEDESPVAKGLAKLSPADQVLAAKQKTCPVTGELLGSMGVPPVVEINGRKVFLCCKGCEAALRKEPGKYLSKLGGK
jgi:multidrug efflux pump subunit AcrA (membrane-fusion protein)